MKPRVVVMASGTGSTFAAIADAVKSNQLNFQIVGLVVSKEGCGAIQEAERRVLPVFVEDPKLHTQRSDFDGALLKILKELKPNWIVLAGYTQLLDSEIVKTFANRIINTHPSLLPKYGGHGMYGRRVHEAVLAAKEKQTGISVHLVTENYDEGPILAQKTVPVMPADSVETLMQRVQGEEKEFYIQSLAQIIR